jgi:hypothetical protein
VTPIFNVETQFGKNHQLQLVIDFHSFEVSPIRSQPYLRLQNIRLGVTMLEDVITLLGLVLLEVLKKLQINISPC